MSVLERVHGRGGSGAGDSVDLSEVETVRAQSDLQTGDLRISGSVNRRDDRQRPDGTDEHKAAAHESDQFGPPRSAPSRNFLGLEPVRRGREREMVG
jgi:hypothetical protein